MSDQLIKDQILSCIKESKRLEKREKLLESLTSLDKVSQFHDNKQIEPSLALRLTKQIALLCNRLVLTVAAKVPYLRRAEQTLLAYMQTFSSSKFGFNEKIFRILLLTYNNWATYYQSNQNYHMTLSYLLKGLKYIKENEIKEPDSYNYVAKTQLNLSALYSELRRYNDAVINAENSLITLQQEMKLRFSNKEFKFLQGKEKKKAENMFVTYVIAFYNIGVAEEYLNHRENMCKAFRNAVEIGSKFLPPDNLFVVNAAKALQEGEQYKSKSMNSPTSRSSIRISPEALVQEIGKSNTCKVALNVQQIGKKPTKPENFPNKNQVKRPGRYYSDAKLKKIQEKLKEHQDMNFVSVDQYFYREISKLMNVKSDIKSLKPLTSTSAKDLWDKPDEEKLKITGLREKKRQHNQVESPNSQKLSEKIQKLKDFDEGELKKQEIKIKSKLKTKVFKHLIQAVNDKAKNYTFPQQSNKKLGLSFKPPLNHLRRCSSEFIDKNSHRSPDGKKGFEIRFGNVQAMKDEIENMMEKITSEIRNIDIEKGVVRAKSPDAFFTSQKLREDDLARSALKNTSRKQRKIITEAVGESFKGRISPRLNNPKVLLRANTLINYQV